MLNVQSFRHQFLINERNLYMNAYVRFIKPLIQLFIYQVGTLRENQQTIHSHQTIGDIHILNIL